MPTIRIDGQDYEVEAGSNLLQACLGLGLDLPYFCWHPAMGSIGACRQCAVVQYQNEEDQRGRIVMGCMTPVTDGAIFSLGGDKASGFRENIVESLMLNHPHDCPVCAEGGECHLQDMTVMVGHRDRHYRGRKNTHRNQYLGPLIHHEMNRCITCYRCTRYYQDYAGGTDLAAMAAHDHIYFGRHEEGVLESEFAGNLVEVCPTGVFTDKSLVHGYTRKWDLQSAPSVCQGCAVGCNTLPGERYGKLKRIHNRFNKAVNGYFLCDRGRFGSAYVNSEERLDYAAQREASGQFRAIHADQAIEYAVGTCAGKRVAAIGSPRASLESNFLLQELVGAAHFCTGVDDAEGRLLQRILGHLGQSPALNPSLQQMERADAILVLGEDPTHTAPRVALALRQSVRNLAFELARELRLESWQDAAVRNLAQDQLSPLHIITGTATRLDDVAASSTQLAPGDQANLADRLANLLAASGEGQTGELDGLLQTICADLCAAKRPLVICGTGSQNPALVDAAARIASALVERNREAMLSYCLGECNSMGSALLARDENPDLAALTAMAERGELDTLLVLENNLYRRAAAEQVERLLAAVPNVIGLDCLEQATLSRCNLVLPAAAFSESEGTLVSSEGRAQRYFPVHTASAERRQPWQWLLALAPAFDSPLATLTHFDEVSAACAASRPLLAGMIEAAPNHDFRSRGLKIPRQPHRYSGRTAMRANVSVHEPKQTEDTESALAYTMEGSSSSPGNQPAALLPLVWSPGWNSNQSLHKFQGDVGGAIIGGSAGVRLLDGAGGVPAPEPTPPQAFEPRPGQWQLIACYRIFGSEELSVRSPTIAELAGDAFVELRGEDARQLEVEEGDGVTVLGTDLEVRINDSLPKGCAGYGAGFAHSGELVGGRWVSLQKASGWQRRNPQLIGSDRGENP